MDDDEIGMSYGELPGDANAVGLVRDYEGRAMFVPNNRAARSLSPEGLTLYADVAAAALQLRYARQALEAAVVEARRDGDVPWSLIGFLTGITESAARKRFQPLVEAAEA